MVPMNTHDNTKNHKFTRKGDWGFISKSVSKEKVKQLRKEAEEFLKKTGIENLAWRSCWQCNGAHCHFLDGKWGDWVLQCMECGKYYYNKVDITDYEVTKEEKK